MIAPRLSGKIKRQVNAESPSVVDVTQTSPAHAARSGADAALYVCRRSCFLCDLLIHTQPLTSRLEIPLAAFPAQSPLCDLS